MYLNTMLGAVEFLALFLTYVADIENVEAEKETKVGISASD